MVLGPFTCLLCIDPPVILNKKIYVVCTDPLVTLNKNIRYKNTVLLKIMNPFYWYIIIEQYQSYIIMYSTIKYIDLSEKI